MLVINATKARNEWSSVVESIFKEKPVFIKLDLSWRAAPDTRA